MQHPFISDLSDKSLDDLQSIIMDLNKKLSFAYRMQNHALIQQMRMVIESYQTEYNKRIDEIYKKQNLTNKINISSDKK